MAKSEIEIVKYPRVKHVKMLVNSIHTKEEHVHNDFEILLVLKNKGYAKIDGSFYEIYPGDIYLINSGSVHAYLSSQGYATALQMDTVGTATPPLFLFVQVSNHFLREYFPEIRTTVFKSCNLANFLDKETLKEVKTLLIEAAIHYFEQDKFFKLDIISDLADVMARIYENVPHEIINEGQKEKLKLKNARLERVISYIDANFDSQIRLSTLAEMENLSATHFSHLFSESFGVTFQEFVNIKRTEQCVRLMANTEKTLLEISYESGFSDPKYMNKMFLKMFGMTPKEYRKNANASINLEIEMGEFENIYNDASSLKAVKEFKVLKLENE